MTYITWIHLVYFRTNFILDKIHTEEVKAEYDTVLSAASPPSSGAATDAPSGWESWLPSWSPLPHYPIFIRKDRDKIDTLLVLVGLHGPHFQGKMIDFSSPDALHLNKAWPRPVPQWLLAQKTCRTSSSLARKGCFHFDFLSFLSKRTLIKLSYCFGNDFLSAYCVLCGSIYDYSLSLSTVTSSVSGPSSEGEDP